MTEGGFESLETLELGCSNGGIGLAQLLLTHALKVEGAFVLVRVAVLRAKKVLTFALKSKQPNLSVAGPAT